MKPSTAQTTNFPSLTCKPHATRPSSGSLSASVYCTHLHFSYSDSLHASFSLICNTVSSHEFLSPSGHHDEALAVAERARTRAFADLLVERQTGQQDTDPYTPVTVEHILDTVNSQRALVLYFSMAAGYLYSWLLAPGAGKDGVIAWPPAHVVNCSVGVEIVLQSFSRRAVSPVSATLCV